MGYAVGTQKSYKLLSDKRKAGACHRKISEIVQTHDELSSKCCLLIKQGSQNIDWLVSPKFVSRANH